MKKNQRPLPPREPRDYGDNDPSDPEQNWDRDW